MAKNKRHKCKNCGRVRNEKFMDIFCALDDGVPVKELYPELKHGRTRWECGDCSENVRGGKS